MTFFSPIAAPAWMRVARREPLTRPAIGQEAAVEPGVGRLVEHDERRRRSTRSRSCWLVGSKRPANPLGVAADRLLDDERPATVQAAPMSLRQRRQARREQGLDPLRPRRVVRPGAERDRDRVAVDRDLDGVSL